MSRDRTARTRIRQFLSTSGPIVDPSGYATGVLKDAIGYSGSSVAFIQLIAAMDRDGEIEREIRGKRTYKIEGIGVPPTPSRGALAPAAQTGTVASVATPGQPTIELDNTCGKTIEQKTIVGDEDGSRNLEERLLELLDAVQIQMVGRFVKQQ